MIHPSVAEALDALRAQPDVVISWVPSGRIEERMASASGPLAGVPFVVKDNIDVAGVPTTAGCPAYAYTPTTSAPVVCRLEAAGAVVVAKTNMDQFATGLVGTRSPYGTPRNPCDPARVPGGSSSGSAVAVAAGAVPFALGTDTAGSGRVPAAFTGIVGAKPTRGWLSTAGVVPAVASVDCVSVFAASVADASLVLALAGGQRPAARQVGTRVGEQGDVDLEPFLEAGRLLYDGPWVAERFAAVGEFIATHPDEVVPVVRDIILGGQRWTADDRTAAEERLAVLKQQVDRVWDRFDALVLPTAPVAPTLAAVAADPVGVNASLGTFTTFTNLLDLCAVVVPTGIEDGLPTSVQVVGPAGADTTVAAIAAGLERPLTVTLAVCGAHMRGLPLHHQLTALGAVFAGEAATVPAYRLYALDTSPPKPGLVRVGEGGASIAVELYRLSYAAFGRFVASVPAPMCIGAVLLEGESVAGFLCEPAAVANAVEITSYGGWRRYLDAG